MSSNSYCLLGAGKCTEGLRFNLVDNSAIVIGRHATCTLVLDKVPVEGADRDYLSRQHAVIENDAGRWRIRDNGSLNGTAILRRGLPPAIKVTTGPGEILQENDVIEFAGCNHFNLIYQALKIESPQIDSDFASGKTDQLIATERRCLQLVHQGVARQFAELGERRIAIGQPSDNSTDSSLAWLIVPNVPKGEILGYVSVQSGKASLLSESPKLLVNLKSQPHGQRTALRDGDLMTIAGIDETSILFLDPGGISPRNLSDLMVADYITIGTASDNTCRLVHPSLSRNHAVIWREDEGLYVRDLGSTNGATVQGKRIVDSQKLAAGDQFSLGRVSFVADAACWKAATTAPSSVDVRFVGVSVEIAGKLRLRAVSLGVAQGEMIGLLGPSASGKSTLLKVLAGHYRLAAGEVYVNGGPMSQSQSRWTWLSSLMGFRGDHHEVGFVQQIDLVQSGLTVRQILEYAARHMGVDNADAHRRAEEASTQCNLGPLMDRVVQTPNGQLNLSGGQLKRICVAIEVLRQPKILVLDEPTTGQDPKNSDDLMHLFRALAQQGVTLLLSTHELRNMELFDKVAVLCLGYLVYYGSPLEFPSYFGADTPDSVYASLPDREARIAEAEELAARFQKSSFYARYCQVDG